MQFIVEKPMVIMQKCENCNCHFFSMVSEQKCVDCCVKGTEEDTNE
jgi:hypothetical protein